MPRKMAFHVRRPIKRHAYPNERRLARALGPLRLSADTIVSAVETFSTATDRIDGVGYQRTVAKELELHLKRVLIDRAALVEVTTKVSPRLGLKCDIALARSEQRPKLIVEIEFRPNYETDAAHCGLQGGLGTLDGGTRHAGEVRKLPARIRTKGLDGAESKQFRRVPKLSYGSSNGCR